MARLANPSTSQRVSAEKSSSMTSGPLRRRVIVDSDEEEEEEEATVTSKSKVVSDSDTDSSSGSDTDSDSYDDAIATVLGTHSKGSSARSSLTYQTGPVKQASNSQHNKENANAPTSTTTSTSTRKPLAADDISSMLTSLSLSHAPNDTHTKSTDKLAHQQQPNKNFFDRINEKKLHRQQNLQHLETPLTRRPAVTETSSSSNIKPKHTYFHDEQQQPKFGQNTQIKKNSAAAAGLVRPRPESRPIPTMQFASKASGINAFQASAMKMAAEKDTTSAEKDIFAPIDPKSAQWGMRIDMDKLKKQAALTQRPPNDTSFITNSQWGTKTGIGILGNLENGPQANDYNYVSTEKTMESLHELFDTFDNKNLQDEDKLPYADGKVKGLKVTLLPHQIRGLRFLLERELPKLSSKGGLLCDDMGLGKTIQSIALILANPKTGEESNKNEKDAPIMTTLVVAPLALVHQWANEIREKAPGLRVMVHHGPKRDKNSRDFKNFHVIVTTFQVVASEYAVNGPLFHQVWWRVIVDEAHSIKNHKAKSTIAACGLRSNRRWCLTGTPIQNSIDELQSLIGFLDIGPFNNRAKWTDQISRAIGAGKGNLALKRLHVVLEAIMLRRTKVVLSESGHFKMPARKVHRRNLTFTDAERNFYTSLEKRVSRALQDMERNYLGALLLLLRLRQACNHISLANGEMVVDLKDQDSLVEVQEETDDLADILSGLSINGGSNKAEDIAVKSAIEDSTSSSKINELLKLLSVDPTRKTIVFSQFTSMLNLIEPALRARNLKYTRYDGSMTSTKREASLDLLRNDPKCTILLCSLKCGALGLNLTCASQVVLIDPWWNPMISEQAIDRVHRLGQTRDVDVYELIVMQSVEERIMLLQDKKRELAKSVVEKGGTFVASNKLTKEELFNIFKE